MDEEKRVETKGGPSEMTVRYYDAAKTSRSVRTLPLFPSVEDFLLKMKLEREDWEKFYGARYHHEADEYIYVNEDGTLMHPN